jgi:hypothetical protein
MYFETVYVNFHEILLDIVENLEPPCLGIVNTEWELLESALSYQEDKLPYP